MLAFLLAFGIQPAAAAKQAPIEPKVDAYLAPYLATRTFSGAILVAKGERVLFAKGYGLANVELDVPNRRNTRFHLASVSKTFTAAAVMLLQERGLLDVHDPVAKLVPGFPNGDRITLHHLLTDTSGLPNINSMPEYEREVKLPHELSAIIDLFRNKPLDFEPGSRGRSESSANWVLLASIIEKVSGRSYGAFLKDEIFTPLGLDDTGHHGDERMLIPKRASGYAPTGYLELENATQIDWSFKTGNASIYSTVDDLFRWQRALADGKLLKPATVQTMWREKYGWFSGERFGRRVVRYNGRAPGFQCEIHRYVDDDVFVAVLSNNYATAASVIVNDVAAIALGEAYSVPAVKMDLKVDAAILAQYTGRYAFGKDFFVPGATGVITLRDGRLFTEGGGVRSSLIPQSDDTFLDRGFWATLRFERNAAGVVDHFVWTYGGETYRAERVDH